MIKYIIMFFDDIEEEWIDGKTAYTLEEAEIKEKELQELGLKTRIVEVPKRA